MKFKTLAVLAVTVLGVSSLAFAGTSNNMNKMLADDSSSQAPMGSPDNSTSGTSSPDNSNMGSSTQDNSMPPSDDTTGSGSGDTGTGDDDY